MLKKFIYSDISSFSSTEIEGGREEGRNEGRKEGRKDPK